MRNLTIFLDEPVPKEEIVRLVKDWGGDWPIPSPIEEGRIGGKKRGGACLFITWDDDPDSDTDDPHDHDDIRAALGAEPRTVVDIHFTSDDESKPLAYELANEILRRWKGVMDESGA